VIERVGRRLNASGGVLQGFSESTDSHTNDAPHHAQRYVNDLLSRRGPLWADRFHSRTLTSPREVRNAIVYVLANFRKHTRHHLRPGLDPYSSAAAFDGWREWQPQLGTPPPFAERKAFRNTRGMSTGIALHVGR
jgi:hypothetical protein